MHCRIILVLLIWTLGELQSTLASRVLFLCPFTSASHGIFYKKLLSGLVKNNHSVRIVSYAKILGNDYGDLVNETLISDFSYAKFPNFFEEKKLKREQMLAFQLHEMGFDVCENFLKSPATMSILTEAKEKPFDVLLTGTLLYECAVPFAHILSIPRILISSASLLPWIDYAVRNPPQWSYAPNIYLPYTTNMKFQERLYNALYSLAIIFHREWTYYPKLDSIIHKYLGSDIPSMSDLDPKVNLVLVNSDPSIDYPRASQSNVIQLGGLHINTSQTIPKDLLKFMEESGDAGVILFSMGSVINDTELNEEYRLNLVQAFQTIPQRVLWKWGHDKPPTDQMDESIQWRKWFPQQAILAHPKVKAFITHGGLGSTLEAVYNGVPIIGIPIFADQEFNIMRAVHDGSGICIDINNLTKSSLIDAISKVTEDSRFRQAMLKRSKILRDKFWDPVELGVYYVEYIIRHKGAPHLQAAATNLKWFQLYQIDVILVILALLLSIMMLIASVLRNITACVFYDRKKSKKVKKY
ncbi:UDP-glucosyltransferase 2-like [Hetaerina americana]|uniref:UDP-glucosyltransferase 2-like n=1 Tax=Hetaerina americana TaxID=62018 RepID=UPI003A7F56B0